MTKRCKGPPTGAGKLGSRHEKMVSKHLLSMVGRLQGREARELGTEEVGGQGKPDATQGMRGPGGRQSRGGDHRRQVRGQALLATGCISWSTSVVTVKGVGLTSPPHSEGRSTGEESEDTGVLLRNRSPGHTWAPALHGAVRPEPGELSSELQGPGWNTRPHA